jgi:hypothetical protein
MKIFIKNMVSTRCIMIVENALNKLGIAYQEVALGHADVVDRLSVPDQKKFNNVLTNSGLELVDDKRTLLIEKIKHVIVQLVLYTDSQIKMNLSSFLSQKLGYDYTYLANIFPRRRALPLKNSGSLIPLNV